MLNKEYYVYKPDYAVHPGEYLEEVLISREIRKKELSERLGISMKHLSQIINRQAMLTPQIAIQLEKTLGVSANIWNNMNAAYSLFHARLRETEELKLKEKWITDFPIKELKKIGVLSSIRNTETIQRELLHFFGVPTPELWQRFYDIRTVRFRKSPVFADNLHHITSWLRVGEIMATEIEAKPFSKEGFKRGLSEIRKLTTRHPDEFEPEIKHLCAESGVILVFVPEFRKTHISGATRWLTPEKALIMMSLRYKTNDHFWFTFFHEAAHILFHGKKDIFIDDQDGFMSKEEDEANHFSKNILIPEIEYRNFVAKGNFYPNDIKSFAKKIGVHPGIVVGRLQYDKRIDYKWHNDLKEKFELKFPVSPSLAMSV